MDWGEATAQWPYTLFGTFRFGGALFFAEDAPHPGMKVGRSTHTTGRFG